MDDESHAGQTDPEEYAAGGGVSSPEEKAEAAWRATDGAGYEIGTAPRLHREYWRLLAHFLQVEIDNLEQQRRGWVRLDDYRRRELRERDGVISRQRETLERLANQLREQAPAPPRTRVYVAQADMPGNDGVYFYAADAVFSTLEEARRYVEAESAAANPVALHQLRANTWRGAGWAISGLVVDAEVTDAE